MKGISRIDSKRTHCWLARVYPPKKTISKTFSDGKYGGRFKAFKAACFWVSMEGNKLCKPLKQCGYLKSIQKNNKTGKTGVSKTFSRSGNGSSVIYPCFNASWNENGRPRSKKFFFSKYNGENNAFIAAVNFRKEKESMLDQKK